MTRREMLVAAPALLGAKTRKVDISRISAISDEIARSPADAIAFAKRYGLRWLELRDVPGGGPGYPDLGADQLKEAARQFRDNGIGISFLDAALYKITLPGAEPARKETPEQRRKREERDGVRFERRMEDLRKALDAAHILGCDKVRVFGFLRVAEPMQVLPRVAEVLHPMVEIASREKIRLLIENEGSCNVATCAELAAIAQLIPSKWFGINFDVLNGLAHNEQPFPYGYGLLPKKRILNVQIKGRSVLDYPQKQDWVSIFHAMTADGYQGCFGLETHIFGEGQIQASHDSMQEILRLLQRV